MKDVLRLREIESLDMELDAFGGRESPKASLLVISKEDWTVGSRKRRDWIR